MANYTKAAEGLDIYPAGTIVADHPWYVMNANYVGTIVANSGAFAGNNSARFSSATATVVSGTEYEFPSTARCRRSDSSPGSSAILAFNGWIKVDAAPTNGTFNLVSMGTNASYTEHNMMVGLNVSAAAGVNLMFARNLSTPTSNPYLFNVTPGQYYWVNVIYAWRGTADVYATYIVDGAVLASNVKLSWTTDAFSVNSVVNRLKFWASSSFTYSVDDFVIQTESNQDSDWTGSTLPQPSDITLLGPRRIYLASAVANGSINQWTSSSGPNYQAATDPTGTNYVTANAYGQIDLYKFSLGSTTPLDITSVVYRGSSVKYRNIKTAYRIGTNPVVTPGGAIGTGPNKYVGIIENDGTAAWTKASIEAAEFGQSS